MTMSGKDKQNIEKTLEEMRAFNRQRIALLEEERNKIREEKNELERYLKTLNEELSSLPPYGVLELGLQRLENVCMILLKAADENSKLIMENAGLKTLNLQNQIKETDLKIEQAKEQIQRELNMIYKMSGGSANPQSAAIIRAWQSDLFSNLSHRQAAAAHFPVKPEGRRDIKEDYSSFSEAGVRGWSYQPADKFKELSDSFSYQPNDKFNGLHNNYSYKSPDKAKELQKLKESNSSQSEERLKSKIEESRHKYMIGKVAGEELVDNSGEVIIRRGEVINLEHIEKARQEGKLSQLIINMIVPGMDESK